MLDILLPSNLHITHSAVVEVAESLGSEDVLSSMKFLPELGFVIEELGSDSMCDFPFDVCIIDLLDVVLS